MLQAIIDGRTDLVFEWVAAGKPATATDDGGVPLAQWCAYYGDVSALRFLLANGATLTELGDNFDLNGAAFHGHWRLCQFLLEAGADVDRALPETGETPLHAALCVADSVPHERVVEVLLAAGADPNRSTLANAATGAFMRDARTRETPLHRAAAFGTERTVDLLLRAGARREVKDRNGDTPLGWASWHLRPAHILELLCFDPHRVHPLAVERSRRYGRAAGMAFNLLGKPRTRPAP